MMEEDVDSVAGNVGGISQYLEKCHLVRLVNVRYVLSSFPSVVFTDT